MSFLVSVNPEATLTRACSSLTIEIRLKVNFRPNIVTKNKYENGVNAIETECECHTRKLGSDNS